jgi:hypothetical protein
MPHAISVLALVQPAGIGAKLVLSAYTVIGTNIKMKIIRIKSMVVFVLIVFPQHREY